MVDLLYRAFAKRANPRPRLKKHPNEPNANSPSSVLGVMVGPVKPRLTRAQLAADRVRRWWPWLVLSFLLHLPVTPLGQFLGLLGILTRLYDEVPAEPIETLEGIPVELLEGPATEANAVTAATVPDGDAVVIAPPKPKLLPKLVKKPEPIDAGVPDVDASTPADLDAGVATGGVGDGGVSDGGVRELDAGVAPDAGSQKRDPFAIAGDFPKAPKSNVNVKIHLFTTNLQKHPAGRAIASLLAGEQQWQDFLGPGGLDPIQDISRIVIYGPQLVDSSKVGVFLEYSTETEDVKKAVDALVKSSENGHWATENNKRVAYVKAASAERVIIFFPGKLIAIVPPGPVHEQLVAAKRMPALPEPGNAYEVFQGALRTPYRVSFFKNFGIEIPKSISEAKLFISTLPNGGASLRLELIDESPESARQHLDEFERQISALTFGMVGSDWKTDTSTIVAEAALSPIQVGRVLSEVNERIKASRRRRQSPK
jgi:hypothetical protein